VRTWCPSCRWWWRVATETPAGAHAPLGQAGHQPIDSSQRTIPHALARGATARQLRRDVMARYEPRHAVLRDAHPERRCQSGVPRVAWHAEATRPKSSASSSPRLKRGRLQHNSCGGGAAGARRPCRGRREGLVGLTSARRRCDPRAAALGTLSAHLGTAWESPLTDHIRNEIRCVACSTSRVSCGIAGSAIDARVALPAARSREELRHKWYLALVG
jgi:hypothetical protein